jgi:mannose-6-phosphate isomerase
MTIPGVFEIKGKVQHYDWGGYDFIAEWSGVANKENKPLAEYWLGAHPAHSSMVIAGGKEWSFQKWIASDPQHILGDKVFHRFGGLPFLVKLLDVRQMLSIQVHPDKKNAGLGFERENAAGIDIMAGERNYRDANHKPEMLVALTDFWLLHGFRNEKSLHDILESIPEFHFLLPVFDEGNYESLYREVMTLPQERVNEVLGPLIERISSLKENTDKMDPHFWAAKAAAAFCDGNVFDRGLFSIYFLNLVHLKKGEGLFQDAGLPHAYLEGRNLEVMSDSDNVIRAGLTRKHIDVPELLRLVRFEATIPRIVSGKGEETDYHFPAQEFHVFGYDLSFERSKEFFQLSPHILVVAEGRVELTHGNHSMEVRRGQSFYILPGIGVRLKAKERSRIFRVFVPGV